ncbi:class I SAM-dependent methyltransferase [Pelagicoccus sp. SDUM812003]|uniref:class I SAM-dependent methyltransferase n=1 Tax=Pelagicoccus sp. SDUM812003 TaxID=3041267 RepID=UPI002810067E|nr:class I SAM-dependent methyltransferase [Pelagicoccus sp. SDUM812003]MDQ8203732.1 class I SAM-dependent methyltransferase [Pelagicoccus sp. SDUM812003]
MDVERVRGYFNEAGSVQHYARAVANVGLWKSEKLLLEKHFGKKEFLLDLGCGAGRVAIGLWEEGFESVIGADLAEEMAREAREIGECLGCPFRFERQDATNLTYPAGSFDGVIFAFNGLMQIPGKAVRQLALQQIYRVLRPGGRFFFCTLDREDRLYSKVFAVADDPEHDHAQNPHLIDFGDRHFETEHGTTFMHVPTRAEVEAALGEAGFELIESAMRSELARESAAVLDFSEDCRLWVARKS